MYADVLPFMPQVAAPAPPKSEPIRLIRAAVGNTVRLIPVQDVICLEAADKYVTVVTAGGESQVRMPLRELATRLSGIELVQIHRSVLVNAARMVSATRDELGHYTLTLRGLDKPVKVSRAFSHLFRPM
jgi:DNA-binding LytR/AlgR family response regulator